MIFKTDSKSPAYIADTSSLLYRTLQGIEANTLSYSDVTGPEISTATGVASVIQQLAAGFGVAISATVLGQLSGLGRVPDLDDFRIAFVVMACFPLATLLWFNQLTLEDGQHVSLHRSTGVVKLNVLRRQ